MTYTLKSTGRTRWDPDDWRRAQYAALALVFALAILLGIVRLVALMSA
jgi:hypothetical protein